MQLKVATPATLYYAVESGDSNGSQRHSSRAIGHHLPHTHTESRPNCTADTETLAHLNYRLEKFHLI
jgi:hypothetical protein